MPLVNPVTVIGLALPLAVKHARAGGDRIAGDRGAAIAGRCGEAHRSLRVAGGGSTDCRRTGHHRDDRKRLRHSRSQRLYVPSPAWSASIVQLPAAKKASTPCWSIVQTPVVDELKAHRQVRPHSCRQRRRRPEGLRPRIVEGDALVALRASNRVGRVPIRAGAMDVHSSATVKE